MNIERAQELLKAWQDGTALDADQAELRGMLPGILERAESVAALRSDLKWFVGDAESTLAAGACYDEDAEVALYEQVHIVKERHSL